ncbi:MAG: hypothetical protein WKF84_27580 [Pyrinomonadaceae bacterium]
MTVTRPMLPTSLIEHADLLRVDATQGLSSAQRTEWGQFFTPPLAAQFMASMFSQGGERIDLLDAGAGTGALIEAFVSEAWSVARATQRNYGYRL